MELQSVAELVQNQSSLVQPETAHRGGFQKGQRAMLFWGFVLFFGGAVVGATLKLLAKEGIRPVGGFTPLVNVVALISAFLGMAFMCYPFLQIVSLGAAKKKKSLRSDPTSPMLGPHPISITEHTTEVLDVARSANERDTDSQE